MPRMTREHVEIVLRGTGLRAKLYLLVAYNASSEPWVTSCSAIAELLRDPAGAHARAAPDTSTIFKALQTMAERGMFTVAGSIAGVTIRFTQAKAKQRIPAAGCNGEAPPGFLRFWAAWPSHFRKAGRALCLEEWRARKLEERTDAVLAVLAMKIKSPDWTKDRGQYIQAPVVWLRAGGYDTTPEDLASAPRSVTAEYMDVARLREADTDAEHAREQAKAKVQTAERLAYFRTLPEAEQKQWIRQVEALPLAPKRPDILLAMSAAAAWKARPSE